LLFDFVEGGTESKGVGNSTNGQIGSGLALPGRLSGLFIATNAAESTVDFAITHSLYNEGSIRKNGFSGSFLTEWHYDRTALSTSAPGEEFIQSPSNFRVSTPLIVLVSIFI
jgi:hypothetical protein